MSHPAIVRAALRATVEASIVGNTQNRLPGDLVLEGSDALRFDLAESLGSTSASTVAGTAIGWSGRPQVPETFYNVATAITSGAVQNYLYARADKYIWALTSVELERPRGCTLNLSLYEKAESPNQAPTKPAPALLQPEVGWVSSVYELVALGNAIEALRAMYWGVEDLLAARNFRLLDQILANITLSRLSVDVMVGLIRSTYRARLALTAWSSLLVRIGGELERRNIQNRNALLAGLK